MRIALHPAARRELHLAIDWYIAEAGNTVAARFVDDFAHLKSLISANPHLGAPGKAGSRRLMFRHFPYTLVYRIRVASVEVLAIAHHSRRPDYWAERM